MEDSDQIADHKNVIMYRKKKERVDQVIRIKDRSKYSKENLQFLLNEYNWNEMMNESLNEKAKLIDKILSESVNRLISEKEININHSKRWFNAELSSLRTQRNNAQLRAEYTNDSADWNNYHILRNQYNNKMNKYKNSDLLESIKKYKSDTKKLWYELKKYMNVNVIKTSEIEFNGRKVTNETQISNEFNEYFINSIDQINQSFQPVI